MPLDGSSKPQLVSLPSNGIDSPEEGYALFITYLGRDWIVLYKDKGNKHSNIHQAKKVMEYLLNEGFISPNEDQQMSVK